MNIPDYQSFGRPDVQAFAGSLEGVRGRKGVFLTTSTFSSDARQRLAGLMVDFGIGVAPVVTYEVKRVDTDYFSEEG